MKRVCALMAVAMVIVSGPVGAEITAGPRSAIGWLSESIKNPPPFEIAPEFPPLTPSLSPEISEKQGLMSISPDSIGLLAPSVTGFPADLWGDMAAADVVTAIRDYPENGPPALQALFRRILLAQANPPVGSSGESLVLQARVDRLFDLGALDAAEALVTLDQPLSRAMFSRTFNIAILTDRTQKVCQALARSAALSDTLGPRVYCLARSGDWNAAAITLSLGATIGAIPPEREDLLVRFLDPELSDNAPDPAIPDQMTPLDFVLREISLLPRPGGALPLPYLYRDTADGTPLRPRIEASERLVHSGAFPAGVLFTAYRIGKAAASGGVWGRQNAVQMLDHALSSGKPDAISEAVQNAYKVMSEIGLLVPLAHEYRDRLAALQYDSAYESATDNIADLLYLANHSAAEWSGHTSHTPRRILAEKLVNGVPLDTAQTTDVLVQAITAAFAGDPPNAPKTGLLLKMLADGKTGQAMLDAMKLLNGGASADPAGIRTGLFILREASQSKVARHIAVQLLLLPPEH